MTGILRSISAGFRHVNTGGRGVVLNERATIYFGSFCLTHLQCERMLSVPAPVRWCTFFEKWDNSIIDMEMWCRLDNSWLFNTLRQGENELHSKHYLLMEYGEWKDRFGLTCNNSPGLPHDSVQHLSVTLATVVRVPASICQTIPERNRQITSIAERLYHIFIYFKINVCSKTSFQWSPQAWLRWQQKHKSR